MIEHIWFSAYLHDGNRDGREMQPSLSESILSGDDRNSGSADILSFSDNNSDSEDALKENILHTGNINDEFRGIIRNWL